MKKIAVIGENGSLATGFKNSEFAKQNIVTCFSKEKYNFTNQEQINKLSSCIRHNDVIIICVGIISTNLWDTYLINTVGIGLLLKNLINYQSTAHIIIAGSHGSMWTAWPDMPEERIWYNNSKKALSDLVTSISHSKISKLKLTLINFSKFKSKMNNYQGCSIEIVINLLIQTINSKYPALVIEMENH